MNININIKGTTMRKNNILVLCGGLLLSSLSLAVTAEQTCNNQIAETTPTSQFEIHSDGTVTDNKTGLMWKQCLEGTSGHTCATGFPDLFHWDEALQAAETLNVSGGYATHTDWRLPNVKELRSIVEYACESPAINLAVFPRSYTSYIWSSSPYKKNEGNSWSVHFGHGGSSWYSRHNAHRVRLVRSVQ